MRARLAVLVIVAAVQGCSPTRIRETHLIQARSGNGEIAYYRLTIAGKATLAKSNYRAGLYDSEAIDSLFGSAEPSDNSSVDRQLETRRKEAVNKIAQQY